MALASLAAIGAPVLKIEVKALAREQVEAFYGARGFAAEILKPYSDACVLSFTAQNETNKTVRYRLSNWSAGKLSFADREIWETAWVKAKVAETARIAFRWAQFPPEQEFSPGDWIMGMAALAARPSGPFRVTARYEDEDGTHEISTEPVSCAH